MPFTADQIQDINALSLTNYIKKGTVFAQNIANKPMLQAFDAAADSFGGGGGTAQKVSINVKAGQGGGSLVGYTGDDQLPFYNPTGIKPAYYTWKEHWIGMQVTMTELKQNGINVSEGDRTSNTSDAEMIQLANILREKNDMMGEDYAYSMDRLIHGDGTTDTKALAGITSFILENPLSGTTGGLSRSVNSWWRNDACTTAAGAAGGLDKITVNPANGGALIEAMDKAERRRKLYANGGTKVRYFAGSDFIDGYKKELRANGNYTMTGWGGGARTDGSMGDPSHNGTPFEHDPTLDALGKSKFCYAIDMGRRGIRLLYLDGNRMKKWNPARPYDRMVMYNGISTDAVMVAYQLNTSGVYEIA